MEPLSRCHRKEQDGYDSVCSYRSFLPDSPQTISPLVCTSKDNWDKGEKGTRTRGEDWFKIIYLCCDNCYNG